MTVAADVDEARETRVAVRDIEKRYGGVQALAGVSLDVRRGSVHGLLGENGAGKSTLVKILTGAVAPDAGTIVVGGREVELPSPRAARELGIGAVHQELSLFPDLTVLGNVFAGVELHDRFGFLQRQRMADELHETMELVGWSIDVHRQVSTLSLAERQMIEILKAFHLSADLILLDEPNSALTDAETRALFGLMRRFQERGQSFLLVSHRLDEVFEMADSITIFRDGRVVAAAPAAELTIREAIRLMVGVADAKPPRRARPAETRDAVRLAAKGLRGRTFDDVSFEVRATEIVGFAGLEGAGVQELFSAIFGLSRPIAGSLELDGAPFAPKHSWEAIAAGVASIPADRQHEGLLMDRTIGENIVLVVLKAIGAFGGFVRRRRIEDAAKRYAERFRVRAPSVHALVSQLSGGNQQKVVLAKWLATKPGLLVLNDPSRGIDVGAKREVQEAVTALADEGMAILIWSSEADELLELCGRVLVLRKGRVVRELDPRSTSRQELLLAMTAEEGEAA